MAETDKPEANADKPVKPEVDEDKAVRTALEIEKEHEEWGDNEFSEDEAKKAMDKLNQLNSEEIKVAFDNLQWDTKDDLARSSDEPYSGWNLTKDKKYGELAKALFDDDKEKASKLKQGEEEKERSKDPKFVEPTKGYSESDIGTGTHLINIELYPPRGTEPGSALDKLVKDTRYAMQLSIDTLGTGKPVDTTAFSKLLDSPLIDDVDGWSAVRKEHSGLTKELADLEKERKDWKAKVDADAFDADNKGKKLWRELVDVYQGLQQVLNWDVPVVKNKGEGGLYASKDGKELLYSPAENGKGDPNKAKLKDTDYHPEIDLKSMGDHPLFKMNKGGDNDGKFSLTPEAEQKYIKVIDEAAEVWDKRYNAAAEYIRNKAGNANDSDSDGDDGKGKPTGDGKETPTGNGKETPTGNGNETPTGNGNNTPDSGNNTPSGPPDTGTGTPDAGERESLVEQAASKPEDGAFKPEDSKDLGLDEELTGYEKEEKDDSGGDSDALEKIIDSADSGESGESSQQSGGNPQTPSQAPDPMAQFAGQLGQMAGPAMGALTNPLQQMAGGGQMRPESAGTTAQDAMYRQQPGSAQSSMPGSAAAQASAGGAPTGATAPAGTPPVPPLGTNPPVNVDMKLPDGSQQKVPSAVADVVNKELNNPNGSNPEGAYGSSMGEAKEVSQAGANTGDIVRWSNGSAILVRQGPGEMFLVIDGQMKPFNVPADNPEYKYFHPSGADAKGGEGSAQQGNGSSAATAVSAPGSGASAGRPPTVQT
ncbi:hypothetical protein [Nocardia mexicana]|uniref:Uncharacterized protein n=1 Tax=Nocardia mexicana TaxID=279262 RepID=A0A370HC78_9NOCA|nr:hypothetical protein [Nocardia mexicana]RDI54546.1 hypothetical protein DFR68_102674 [Nocardia mexicana]